MKYKAFDLINKRFYGKGIADLRAWQDEFVEALREVPAWTKSVVVSKYMALLVSNEMNSELETVEDWLIMWA